MKQILYLSGLDCANCAAELERKIAKMKGVFSVSLSFAYQKLTLECVDEQVLQSVKDVINAFEEVRIVEKEFANAKKREKALFWAWLQIACAAIILVVAALLARLGKGNTAQICAYICYGLAYFAVGYPVLWATAKNLIKRKLFNENFLMTVASICAFCLGEWLEGVAVMLLYQIGETLQAMAVASSRRSVTQLMDLKSEWATLLVQKECACACHANEHDEHNEHDKLHAYKGLIEQVQIKPEQVKVGDVLLVKAGEKIPTDGVLLSKTAILDRKALTGEVRLQEIGVGEEILSGCINAGGAFEMRALRPYADSTVSKILDMVENASSRKANFEKFITKFAKYYTPIVCCFALALALFAPIISGFFADGRMYFKDLPRWGESALIFLVVSCPCALVISVPLTYFSGIGACARQGILVKGAIYLDVVAKANIAVFDKTGTLTEGRFTVCGVYPREGVSQSELLSIIAAVEQNSTHPIAKAFLVYNVRMLVYDVQEIVGLGMVAKTKEDRLLVGNAELLRQNGVAFEEKTSVHTLVYAARNGEYLGVVELGDRLRKEVVATVRELKQLGLKKSVMLTGDQMSQAQSVAREAGIEETYAELLPGDKVEKVNAFKQQGIVLYVGDGINDAPVMAAADCSVSMGKLGSAAAVEASDLVLISDALKALPSAVKIARETRKIVIENIAFSIAMKTVFLALGVTGILPLWLAVFADVGVMLMAVANSFRVRLKRV